MSELTREEFDMRLETIVARIDAQFETAQVRTDAQFEAAQSRTDARFALAEAQLQKSIAELIKWVVGTGVALAAFGLTLAIFVDNHAAPKMQAPQAPIAQAPGPQSSAPIIINFSAPALPAQPR